jgi:hypothetical protein
MPQIIVTADQRTDGVETPVMLRERVNASDFESDHFAGQLVERISWAVGDAHEVERSASPDRLRRADRGAPTDRRPRADRRPHEASRA